MTLLRVIYFKNINSIEGNKVQLKLTKYVTNTNYLLSDSRYTVNTCYIYYLFSPEIEVMSDLSNYGVLSSDSFVGNIVVIN